MKHTFFYISLLLCIGLLTHVARTSWIDSITDKSLLRYDYKTINSLLIRAKSELEKSPANQLKHKFFISDDPYLHLFGFVKKQTINEIDESLISNSAFVVYFHTDDDYFYTLKKIKDNGGIFCSLPNFLRSKYIWVDKNAMKAVDDTFAFDTKVSHLFLDVHETICLCLNATKNLPGDYVEIGVYKGGSALTALHYMKYAEIDRKSYFFDTYNGMTYEEAYASSDTVWQNTHVLWGVKQTMKYVEDLLKTTGRHFTLVESNICKDPMPTEIKQIVVCNIDVDLYDATADALTKVAPLMVKGGIIICEDPTAMPWLGGAFLAMEEFLQTAIGNKFMKIFHKAQYLLIKMEE